jgi:hypothetical protein
MHNYLTRSSLVIAGITGAIYHVGVLVTLATVLA